MDFKRSGVYLVTEITKLILWTGPKHSGKTLRLAELVNEAREKRFTVAGILALSLYENDKLIGFDVLDIQKQERQQLLRRNSTHKQYFSLIPEGMELGYNALNEKATEYVDLIIIDEFGPLELNGNLWRKKVDTLIESEKLVLLVVRNELVREVRQIYSDIPFMEIAASDSESVKKVLNVLINRQSLLLVSE